MRGMDEEKRKHHHIAVNAFVRFYQEPFDRITPQYHRGMVKNYSKGGMCILTNHPFPKGCVVTVELPIESETEDLAIIEVRGTVQWVRQMQGRRGMGIQFFEFKGSSDKDFDDWMANLIVE